MAGSHVLVTGAAGRIGTAVVAQLLEKGVPTRAMVRRRDTRSARMESWGAQVVVCDMLDIRQVQAAMEGVSRLFFNPPYHPHGLHSAVAFAVAARREGVDAVVSLGQWLASPEHPSLMTRHHWLTDNLFELLPDAAHVAVNPGFFADNYMCVIPTASQLGLFPFPTGACRNAPPSNEDIARVVVGTLVDPRRHDGRMYRPTGPALLSGPEIADALGEALGRSVRHVDVPHRMFMKAIRASAKQMGIDIYTESGMNHYARESALGTWEVGAPTTHVRDVAGVEPEDMATIFRRYTSSPQARRTVRNFLGALAGSVKAAVMPMRDHDGYEQAQQHPRPSWPKLSGESEFWRGEHAPALSTAAAPYEVDL